MAINESRYITIDNKIVTRENIFRLANGVYSIYKKKRCKYKEIKFIVICDENAMFDRSEPDIFAENSPIISKRVLKIKMEAWFPTQDIVTMETIEINLTHDPSDDFSITNSIKVQGFDSNWVNGTLKRLEEITDSFTPQNTFVRRYQVLLRIVLSLSIGYVLLNYFLLPFIVLLSNPSNKLPQKLANNQFLLIAVIIFLQLITSFFLGASPAIEIVKKLRSLYPNLELQVAPEHKQIEKQRRIWTFNAVTLVVLPLIFQLVYEIVKRFL